MAALVELLAEAPTLRVPLFVFIDEIDRCRPDFAIKLLEEIKYIFSVKGVVFVLSVNLEQLSWPISGAYGGGFDGHAYLQRFFDLQFLLPEPSSDDQ